MVELDREHLAREVSRNFGYQPKRIIDRITGEDLLNPKVTVWDVILKTLKDKAQEDGR